MAAHDALPGQAPTAETVMVHLRYVVQFCWAAHKKLLPALCYTVGSHDTRISAWAAGRTHHACKSEYAGRYGPIG
jgi:hypothetical protein